MTKQVKMEIREPFPCINTTDPFVTDRNTAHVIINMFNQLHMKSKGYRLEAELLKEKKEYDIRRMEQEVPSWN
jgi:hypothetical protein